MKPCNTKPVSLAGGSSLVDHLFTPFKILVCCGNRCEDVLNEIEASVRAPVAYHKDILIPLANLTNFDLSAAMIEVTLPVDFTQLLLLREIASRSKYRDSYGFRVSGDSLVLQDSTDHVYVERDGIEMGERWERDGGGKLDRERDSETVRQ